MDVRAVLEGTFSPDHNIRTAAEQQLSQAQEADFPLYLTTLGNELANSEAPSEIRIAAALALKNSFTAREFGRLRQVQERWMQLDPQLRGSMKELGMTTLMSDDGRASHAAAQFIAAIAAIELPRNEWPELMALLVENVSTGQDHQKQACLTALGYICETDDNDLRDNLAAHSNAILSAIVKGAQKEVTNNEVRNAAISALSDALEFVRANMEAEGERNYIMQVVCEATQADDSRVQQGAWGCLNRIMALYYDKMRFYMEKALFGLTIQGMKSEEEEVAKLAVEFWCTVCEEEMSIEDDNSQAQAENSTELRDYFSFARIATNEVVPVLLELLTKQDEDAADDEYNISRAAYQCLQLWAQTVSSPIVHVVLPFVESNLRVENWHLREAAVSAFGAILEGPEQVGLEPLVKQAINALIGMMTDENIFVRDSTAFTLGRICETCSQAIEPTVLPNLIACLFEGLTSHPKMASSCCWALMNLAEQFSGEPGCQTNALSAHFKDSISAILRVTERSDADNQLRTAAYEVLNSFVTNAANDSMPLVAELSNVVLTRLEGSIGLQSQVVSVDDKLTLEEMQTSLTSAVVAIITRLDSEIKPQADRIMQVCLQLLQAVGPRSSVPDTVFTAVGSLSGALETEFLQYMEAFAPFLYRGLENQEEASLCSMSIGLVSDITRSLGEKVQPWCDDFMNRLLHDLQSQTLGNQFKPAILQCFGDIAQAIGGHYETYLPIVATVLKQAAHVSAGPEAPYELQDYVVSLREGIMDAWDGIIVAMSTGGKTSMLSEHVEHIFDLVSLVFQDSNRSEALLRACMGVIGDLSKAFPSGEYSNLFRQDWLMTMSKEIRTNRDFSERTIQTARWARDQIKRQIGGTSSQLA